MTKARRKTTQQERIQIVQYCLNHDKNYSEAAASFSCSYQQATAGPKSIWLTVKKA